MNTIKTHMALCMMCHKKNDTSLINKLQRLQTEIQRAKIEPHKTSNYTFMWGINPHCSYGIQCNNLDNIKHKANHIARQLEPYLISIALSDNEQMYHIVLQYLRGDFPSVYHTIEKLHAKYKHDNACKN